MELKELIHTLSEMDGPSGFEQNVTGWLMEQATPLCDDAYTDVMGNLIAVQKCGKADAKRILIAAHIDEIGMIVTGHEKGFLHFASLGGVDARILPAMQVKVLTCPPIRGIIDSLPPHALSAGEMEKPFSMDKLTIDLAMTQEEAIAAVPLGTPVVFDVQPMDLGKYGVCGKAMDDRACAAIQFAIMQELADAQLDMDVYYLFSAQEEVGARGAQAGAYGVNPDYAIAMDVTFAKTPDGNGYALADLGKGPSIGIGPNMSHFMSVELKELAKKLEIPYQIEVCRGNSHTDLWPIQVARSGVATALVSLPLRYMHTPHEVMDMRDAQNMVRLVSSYIRQLGGQADA